MFEINKISKLAKGFLSDWNTVLKDQFEGKDAIIPFGKFKGRLGKIDHISLNSDGTISALIIPYHKKYGKPVLLTQSQDDVRTYWPIGDKDIVKEKGNEA